jgi:hypothetical protein
MLVAEGFLRTGTSGRLNSSDPAVIVKAETSKSCAVVRRSKTLARHFDARLVMVSNSELAQ